MLAPVLREVVEEGKDISHHSEDWSGPGSNNSNNLDYKLMLGLQLCTRNITDKELAEFHNCLLFDKKLIYDAMIR